MKSMGLLLLVILFSCKTNTNKVSNNLDIAQEGDSLTVLLRDNYGGTEQQELLVFKSKKELTSFMSKINRTRKPGLPTPEVDFDSAMVLVFCKGKTTGNTDATLYVMEETSDSLVLGVKINSTVQEPKNSNNRVSDGEAELYPFVLYEIPVKQKKIALRTTK